MNTAGLPMPRGTWLILVVAVLPVLASQVASAAPGYPVEDPQGTSYTVAYDPPSHILTVTSPTSTPQVDDPGVDTVVSGVAEGPNGQVNHGQVINQLHVLTDGRNSGCLTSAVAKTDLGRGDESVSADEIGSLVIDVDCSRTSDSTDRGSVKSDEASGKSDKAAEEKPEKPHGKSDKAPGEDK